jgi:pimeloyl-ACP methyl ester carboxylesterase
MFVNSSLWFGGIVFYTTLGEQTDWPLVLVHGNSMTAASQERLARRFTDTHRVISVDLLGHGRSARPASLFSESYFTLQGEALADLLRALFPHTPAVVFGMSAGAVAALNAACEADVPIAALVLDSVFRVVGPSTLAAHRTSVETLSAPWERYMRSQHGDEWWPHLLRGLLAVIEQLAATGASVVPCLDTIRLPVLIFQGGRDHFCPEDQGRSLAAAIPGSRLVYDSHAGHILAWQHPAAFREIVRDFLEGVRSARHETRNR